MGKSQLGPNEFKLAMTLAKSRIEENSEGIVKRYVSGLASGLNVDLETDRMTTGAIDAFKKAIDEGVVLPNGEWSLIPLRSGHRKEWDDVLGWITKAHVDEDYNLWIEAELEDTHAADDFYRKLNEPVRKGRPVQLGLSVGGKIISAMQEFDQQLQKMVRIITGVRLTEISVTSQPANPITYIEALQKSVDWDSFVTNEEETAKEINMNKSEETLTAEATEVVAENVENLAKSEQSDVTAEAIVDLQKNVSDLVTIVSGLVSRVDAMTASPEAPTSEEVVEKSETEVSAPSTEDLMKSLQESITGAVSEMLEKFQTNSIDPLKAEVASVKDAVTVIGSQELDKSLSVTTAQRAQEQMGEIIEKARTDSTFDVIGATIRASVAKRQAASEQNS